MKPYIESQYLHVFVTLARTLNMSEAARELGQTPSAISHALKALETNLGCRIFERSPRHMTLLPLGHTLLTDAVTILDQLRLLRANVDARSGKPKTGLRLSVTAEVFKYVVPAVLQKFSVLFPDFPVEIEESTTAKVSTTLTSGQVNLAIMLEPARNPDLDFTLLGTDELRLIVNLHHAWANQSRIPRAEILAQKFLITDFGGQLTWLTDYFQITTGKSAAHFELEIEHTVNTRLSQNTGIALLPKWTVAAQLKAGYLAQLPLGSAPLLRRWVLACRKSYTLNPAETLFVNLIKPEFRSWRR